MSIATRLIAAATVFLLLGAGDLCGQSLWKMSRRKLSPVEDLIARKIGDILTIIVREDHKTSSQDKTDRKQDNSLATSLEEYSLSSKTFRTTLPAIDLRGKKIFKGENKQDRDQSVEARIAVIVVDVHPNGNLVISGKRRIMVDDEVRTLRISGVIRVHDISSDNTIRSDQVADARIAIESTGAGREFTTRGPVASLFHTMVWFFWPF